jgi:hypothetical protein
VKRLSSSEFRLVYSRESEPIEVTAYDRVIGTWYPAGTDLSVGESGSETSVEAAPEVRFTIRPAHGPRPEMVGVTKRVLDPLDMRRNEQSRSDEFHPRQYGPRDR